MTDPTTPNGWVPGNPLGMRRLLENIAWGYASTNGQTTALFCPMCYAMVPAMSDNTGPTSARQVHIEFHVTLAQHIQQIEEAHAT